MINKTYFIFIILLQLVYFGCNSNEYSDTPTTGILYISADETFKPLIDSEINTFKQIYHYADVKVSYKPQEQAFNDLMNDTIKLIITSRGLNNEERKIFEKWEIVPKVTKIAYDGIALIGTKDINDTVLTLDEIKNLLSGKNLKSYLRNTKVVFDNNSSSTISFLLEKTGIKSLSKNCFALNSNEQVMDYISKSKNSIGIIGVNWISDQDDTTHLSFLNSVKIIGIALNESSEYYKPYQAYIAQKVYPLYREVFIISKEAYTGLGTGFTAFVASERGQRIVLKFGLVPATMPTRLVELIDENI